MVKQGDNVSTAARELGNYVSRIEKLNEDKKAVAEDIKVVFQEAKAKGFDVKVMREVIKRRAKDKADVEEFDAMLANYETNLDSVLE
jgi:uncharacterized protein (UPF0335 family)